MSLYLDAANVGRPFKLLPSFYLTLYFLILHATVMGAFYLVPVSQIVFAMLLIILACSMTYYVLRDALLKLDSAWVALRLEDDHVVLFNRTGDALTGDLLGTSIVTPYMVILNISILGQRRRRNVVMISDSMEAEHFRQLRIALKWRAVLQIEVGGSKDGGGGI